MHLTCIDVLVQCKSQVKKEGKVVRWGVRMRNIMCDCDWRHASEPLHELSNRSGRSSERILGPQRTLRINYNSVAEVPRF